MIKVDMLVKGALRASNADRRSLFVVYPNNLLNKQSVELSVICDVTIMKKPNLMRLL